jgi:hypothetical protein
MPEIHWSSLGAARGASHPMNPDISQRGSTLLLQYTLMQGW